jgi:DNA primase
LPNILTLEKVNLTEATKGIDVILSCDVLWTCRETQTFQYLVLTPATTRFPDTSVSTETFTRRHKAIDYNKLINVRL